MSSTELQAGWDQHDAGITNRHFADDIVWGSPFDAVLQGYEQLHAIHVRLKRQATGGTSSRYEIVRVLAPTPDVAVAQVRRVTLDPAGHPLEPVCDLTGAFSEMALYVLVRRDRTWWVAAGQNTLIRPGPPQSQAPSTAPEDVVQEAFARLAESRRPTATAEPPEAPGGSPDPADRVILHDEVRRAISVVIGRLSPAERTSFILDDVFGFPFDGPGGTRAAGLAERFIAVCDGGDMHELIGLLDPGAAGSPVVIGLGPMPGVRGAKAVAGRAMT